MEIARVVGDVLRMTSSRTIGFALLFGLAFAQVACVHEDLSRDAVTASARNERVQRPHGSLDVPGRDDESSTAGPPPRHSSVVPRADRTRR